jgi:uncharacterized protein involved in exopolysaccharide biosynthesis/Mrp family chromosome partitioning ATPase
MNGDPVSPPAPGISLGDVLYVLFKHKWKILSMSLVGIIGALLLPLLMPPPYESEAKLFIKYVLETKSPTQVGGSESRIKSIDVEGKNIINTELEILSSLDLAEQVATEVGPEKILGKSSSKGNSTNAYQAALLIRRNLLLEVPKMSDVIRVVFQYSERDVVQPVLRGLIEGYLKRHQEAHRPSAVSDEVLTQETDQIHSQLLDIERDLREAIAKAGVISVEDSKKIYSDQMAKIRQLILDAQTELAERQAAVIELTKLVPAQSTVATNQVLVTNELAVSSERVSEYKRVCGLLDTLVKRDQELSITFTANNSIVQQNRQQMAANEKLKKRLEEEHPGLLSVKVSDSKTIAEDPSLTARNELATEKTRVATLQAKLKVLAEQLDALRKEASGIYEAEGSITELQRRRKLSEAHYTYFSESLANARIDERLGAGKIPNISKIQEPSLPFRAPQKLYKLMAMILLGCIGGAIGFAFLNEFFLDQSLKRPIEVEAKLGLPLFLSIPLLKLNGHARPLAAGKKRALLPESAGPLSQSKSDLPSVPSHEAELAAWDPRHVLRPFYEALRDRLITFFEVSQLNHKPKLVAVTSCADGSGVSTVAAGLAASLSETGEGNVLLVDMNQRNGAAHQFYKGDLACGLDDALEMERRDSALVQENLYVVAEGGNSDKLPSALPKRFKALVPRLKASDYDYIIFDMPPVSQISITPRLARFMDMVFMVVESEKTDRDVVKRASAMLTEAKANIGIVLNKNRSYVPRRLQQQL